MSHEIIIFFYTIFGWQRLDTFLRTQLIHNCGGQPHFWKLVGLSSNTSSYSTVQHFMELLHDIILCDNIGAR